MIEASRSGTLTVESWRASRDHISHRRYRLTCPTCGREERLSEDRALQWLLALAASGQTQVSADIGEVSATRSTSRSHG